MVMVTCTRRVGVRGQDRHVGVEFACAIIVVIVGRFIVMSFDGRNGRGLQCVAKTDSVRQRGKRHQQHRQQRARHQSTQH